MRIHNAVAIFMLFVSSSVWADSTAQSQQLLSYFSSGCQTYGQWTQSALQGTNGLLAAVEAIANDPACQTVAGSLSSFSNITVALQNLNNASDSTTLQSLQQEEETYYQYLSTAKSADDIESITSYLATLQTQIITAQLSVNADQARPYQSVVTNAQLALSQIAKNPACMQKHTDDLAAIASAAGSIGAVTATGGASLIISAATDVFDSILQTAQTAKFNKKIRAADSPNWATAFACTMESLETQYCKSLDADKILQIAANSQDNLTELQQTTLLLNKDLPSVLNWLNELRTAAPGPDSTRQVQVLQRAQEVLSAPLSGQNVIADNLDNFNNSVAAAPLTKADVQWNIEQQVLTQVVAKLTEQWVGTNGTAPANSPFNDVLGGNAKLVGPWYLIGVSETNIPKDSEQHTPIALSNYSLEDLAALTPSITPAGFVPDLTTNDPYSVTYNLNQWVMQAQSLVDTERASILSSDPTLTITNSALLSQNNRSAPFYSLLKLLQFIQKLYADEGSATGSFSATLTATQTQLKNIACGVKKIVGDHPFQTQNATNWQQSDGLIATLLFDCPAPIPGKDTPQTIISDIYNAANLDNGTSAMNNALTFALTLKLHSIVNSASTGPNPTSIAVLLAQADYVADLQSYAGQDQQSAHSDLLSAQSVLTKNLTEFTDTFSDALKATLQGYRKSNSPQDLQQAAKLCSLMLAVPTWPKGIPQKLCTGLSYDSVYTVIPPLPITAQDYGADYNTRACKYYQFQQTNAMHQALAIPRQKQ